MSLRFALLGLLDDEPGSGYELTQRFAGIDRYAWSATHSQIYPELRRLADDGLIEVVAEGARGSKTYAVTDTGRTALRDWLLSPTDIKGVRNEFVLRLFLLGALSAADATTILEGTRSSAAAHADALEAEFAELADKGRRPDGSTAVGAPGFAAQFGIHSYRATVDWATWALGQLDQENEFD